jgi:hypothetical protein
MNKDVNKRIYESLVKRDSKEKHITVCKLVQANEDLMSMVSTLKMELDEKQNKLDAVRSKFVLEKQKTQEIQRKKGI